MSVIRRFRSAVTGLFVSKKAAQANPRETVGERASALAALCQDALSEVDSAVFWLDQKAVHAAECRTYVTPIAKCSCGLARTLLGLRAVQHDLRLGV